MQRVYSEGTLEWVCWHHDNIMQRLHYSVDTILFVILICFVEAEGGMHPIDIITEAWHATTSQKVLGSSTICIATVDMTHNQLLYSNIGDCGLMVLRHIDSEVAGYMRCVLTPSIRFNYFPCIEIEDILLLVCLMCLILLLLLVADSLLCMTEIATHPDT